jgi:hypothetical protein
MRWFSVQYYAYHVTGWLVSEIICEVMLVFIT